MRRIIKLAKEPSTWSGIAAMLGGAAVLGFSEEVWMAIFGVFMAIAGAIAAVKLDPADED